MVRLEGLRRHNILQNGAAGGHKPGRIVLMMQQLAQPSCARVGMGDTIMVLKAPGIITFILSIILTVCVLVVKFFGAQIPLMLGNEFWFLLLAHVILLLGCIMRGL
jgi:hypothetical protein